jgi:hypothetical protein
MLKKWIDDLSKLSKFVMLCAYLKNETLVVQRFTTLVDKLLCYRTVKRVWGWKLWTRCRKGSLSPGGGTIYVCMGIYH